MIKNRFPTHRKIVGWVSLIFGLGCWALFLPKSERDSYFNPTVLFVLSGMAFLFFSFVNKIMRITGQHSPLVLVASVILLFMTLWFYILAPNGAKPLHIPNPFGALYLVWLYLLSPDYVSPPKISVGFGIAFLVWILIWVSVDFLDIGNHPVKDPRDE